MLRSTILMIIAMFISLSLNAQKDWKLVYHNDKNGNKIEGELQELMEAIRLGKEIRIYFQMKRQDDSKVFVEHLTEAKYLTILNSPSGNHVTAQIDPIVGQVPVFDKGHILLKENLEWSLIVSTNGVNDMMTRHLVTGEVMDHRSVRWSTKWYTYMDKK